MSFFLLFRPEHAETIETRIVTGAGWTERFISVSKIWENGSEEGIVGPDTVVLASDSASTEMAMTEAA